MKEVTIETRPTVARVVTPTPRGWFSRLVWRWVRYDQPEEGEIRLTFVPAPQTQVFLGATWVEFPYDGNTYSAVVGTKGGRLGVADSTEEVSSG